MKKYIQLPRIAKDFANYLQLYYKYQKTYHVDEILSGAWPKTTASEFRAATFDEKLSVLGLLLSRLGETSRKARHQDAVTTALHETLREFKARIETEQPQVALAELIAARQDALRIAKETGQLDAETRTLRSRELTALENYLDTLRDSGITAPDAAMDAVREHFGEVVEARKKLGEETDAQFANAFAFLENAVGEGQELVLFVTEITAGYDTSWFVETFGCEAYFRHNRELLLDETRERLTREIAEAEQ